MLPGKISEKFRNSDLAQKLTRRIHETVDRPIRIMEVCGTHTMAIFRHGIRSLLPENIELISGPGCPVCVTSAGDIDQIIELAEIPNIIIATFGDLIRVPGSNRKNLAAARADGAQVEIVYSPTDALKIAQETDKQVVFPAIGFETTIPIIAATVFEAQQKDINNLLFLISHKVVPPALEVLLSDPDLALDGILCPGHVSAIIGQQTYEPFAQKYHIPCVITGFEPLDILSSIYMLAKQIQNNNAEVENTYTRAVSLTGNERARQMIDKIFAPCDARWRGLGIIPDSGLKLKPEYIHYDAARFFNLSSENTPEPKGCRCGEILTAKATPPDCPLFNTRCTPTNPVGPCMVSSEGTCAAYNKYGLL